MSNAIKCESCGAAIHEGAHACAYCGTAIATNEPPPPPPPPSPHEIRAQRFHQLKQHPSYQGLLEYQPPSTGPAAGLVFQGIFGLIFAGVSGFIAAAFGESGAGALSALPILFVLVGLGISISAVVRFLNFEQAPVRAFAARIATKDIRESRTSNHTSITYYVTIETEHGERHPYSVSHSVYSMTEEDDMGVAHVRDTFLLNFTKVDV